MAPPRPSSTKLRYRRSELMTGTIVFFIGASLAAIAIAAWAVARWRTARSGGGRRW